jgi:signal peptidase I
MSSDFERRMEGRPEEPGPERVPDATPPPARELPAAKTEKRSSLTRTVVEVVLIVAAAVVIALLVQAFLVKPFTIHQVSMRPTLEEGDRVLINRLAYRFGEPSRGDIVVLHSPINADEDLVKRIVALAGDRVAVSDGRLYVNGVAQEEPYLLEQDMKGDMPETLVPEGHVFVMGDNRNNSGDSRMFGPVTRESLIGSAFGVYWPISRWKTL